MYQLKQDSIAALDPQSVNKLLSKTINAKFTALIISENHVCANNYRAYEKAKKRKTTDVDSNQLTSASGSEPS